MQITIEQMTLNVQMPMNHLTKCWQGKCPYGETICCYECDAKCIDRCDNMDCRREQVGKRVHKNG